jgi:hypothetical protein
VMVSGIIGHTFHFWTAGFRYLLGFWYGLCIPDMSGVWS